MDASLEYRIRERAYFLWQKEGCPDGREQEFWERACLMEEAAAADPVATPLGDRTAAEREVDQASAESFPASDPPSFTPQAGSRVEGSKPASGQRR